MKTKSRFASGALRLTGAATTCALAWLLATGCQTAAKAPSSTETATSEATANATHSITLTWDQQNNCVNFNPPSLHVKVGDHVQFNSSVNQTVTIRVDASAFGVSDTLITVAQGANQTTHSAQTPGTYMWRATPGACANTSGGPGPDVVVDAGK